MNFVWDTGKAATNVQKHGVSFEEAESVFEDRLAVIFDDESHSDEEPREIIVGHSNRSRLLLVSFTERLEVLRIISARQATRQEQRDYEQNAAS